MKKLAFLALASMMAIAIALPAAALENEFGGYWRTRFMSQGNFNGEDDNGENLRQVDTRTRLYYTAKINDNLKFVNKFEFDATWGSSAGSRNGRSTTTATTVTGGVTATSAPFVTSGNNRGYGEPGADAANIEIKNSYADFNLGPVNFTVGVQPYVLFREFYISEDASGVIARWKVLDNFVLAGSWLKNYDGGSGSGNNEDIDAYTLSGAFWFSENISIKPSISYSRASELNSDYVADLLDAPFATAISFDDLNLYTYGLDFDANFDNFGVWATLAVQSGDANINTAGVEDIEFGGWLAAVGGNVMLGPVDLHGQFFLASGDEEDDLSVDQDYDAFFNPLGSYYWSEIMGYGLFDNNSPTNTPADKISNVMAANIGASMKPMDKLKVTVDLWYAEAEEDIVFAATGAQEDKYGTELDVRVTYELVEGLNLDLVGAYLWAGDAISTDGDNDEDPYEFGARLSLSF